MCGLPSDLRSFRSCQLEVDDRMASHRRPAENSQQAFPIVPQPQGKYLRPCLGDPQRPPGPVAFGNSGGYCEVVAKPLAPSRMRWEGETADRRGLRYPAWRSEHPWGYPGEQDRAFRRQPDRMRIQAIRATPPGCELATRPS